LTFVFRFFAIFSISFQKTGSSLLLILLFWSLTEKTKKNDKNVGGDSFLVLFWGGLFKVPV
jgi:hypothetical protein